MFNVIALLEIWLSKEKGADVELEGYKLFTVLLIERTKREEELPCM